MLRFLPPDGERLGRLTSLLVVLACLWQTSAQAERNEAYQERSTAPFSTQAIRPLQDYSTQSRQIIGMKIGSPEQPDGHPAENDFAAALRSARQSFETITQHEPQRAGGPGIVISGGGSDLYARAVLLVKFIRKELKCDLPIEVSVVPDYSTSSFMQKALKSGSKSQGKKFIADFLSVALEDEGDQKEENLQIVDLKKANSSLASRLNMFDFKGMHRIVSIEQSQFDQVIYMDVENLPLTAPSEMLKWADFIRAGDLFWPSLQSSSDVQASQERIWKQAGFEAPWRNQKLWRTTETGQLLIDKKRHADVMGWVVALAGMDKEVYHALGDESGIWELAFALAGKLDEFNKLSHWPRVAMSAKLEEVYEMKAIVHNSPLGVPCFLRRTDIKGLNSFRTALPAIEWLTVPLADAGWHAFAFQEHVGKFGIHDQSTIYPDDTDCSCVDVATALQFSQQKPDRWKPCTSSFQSLSRKLPVALLPLSWYPSDMIAAIRRVEKAVALMSDLLLAAKQPKSGVPRSQYDATGVNYTSNFLQDQPEYKIGTEDASIRDEKLTNAVAELYSEYNWLGDGGRAEAGRRAEAEPDVVNARQPDLRDSLPGSQRLESGLYMISGTQQLASPLSETELDLELASRNRQSSLKDPGKSAVRIKRALGEGHSSRNGRRANLNVRKRNSRSRRLGRSSQA